MSLLPLLSFASGELDPVLTDNVTLEKFKKGLATARNVMITKTGSISSRFAREYRKAAKLADKKIKIYCPQNTDWVLEFGESYLRFFEEDNVIGVGETLSLVKELVTDYTEDDLDNLHFTANKDFIFIFCKAKQTKKLILNPTGFSLDPTFALAAAMFSIPSTTITSSVTPAGTPSGYPVDYMITLVINGEETLGSSITGGVNKPISATQSNVIKGVWVTSSIATSQITEARVYSRPSGGGAFGFMGSTNKFVTAGANTEAYFLDFGQSPDYTNGTQDLVTKYGMNGIAIKDLNSRTGIIYQQRLVVTADSNEEALAASRPGYYNNFYTDFPAAADSALLFKSGTSGKANVLRLLDSDGIIAFTTNGVYMNTGLLGPDNTGMDRKGSWVIKETLPPLVVPGGVFFVDRTNTIRQLVFSQDILAYESVEQTIFSNHLFKNRVINSWTFQDGTTPVIIVSFTDGTFATFTYNFEHQMKAWTRHDSKYPVEQVEGTSKPDKSYFVINKNGQRYIEVSLPRITPVEIIVNDMEADKRYSGFMDGITSVSYRLNDWFDPLVGKLPTENFIVTPVTAGVWNGPLTITSTYPSFQFSGKCVQNDVLKFFNPDDRTEVDLTITSVVAGSGTTSITVTPSDTFPSKWAASNKTNLYVTIGGPTYPKITGLTQFEGEDVSLIVDGYIVGSPYNDKEGYSTVTVTGGEITLPSGMKGAIILIGRPICADVKTLNISSVEQSPVLIESINVNKLYVRVEQSRGIYCDNVFPEERTGGKDGTSVIAMDALHKELIPPDDIIIGNRYFQPVSKRCEKTLRGDWNSQGRISLRQVDPFHFEILSIIPDITVLKRSDR